MSELITKSRDVWIAIGELAKRTGVPIGTIRYYERVGLLSKPDRASNGRRMFGEQHVTRLSFVRRSRNMGFSQDEVRTLLKLADGGARSCNEVRALAMSHLQDVRSKINDLRRMEIVLEVTVSKCTGESAPACPVLDALGGKIDD